MNKNIFLVSCAVLLVALAVFTSCAGGAASMDKTAVFNDLAGKEWTLSEVRSAGGTVKIDRNKLAADNMDTYFTVSFEADRISGVGAPNRFFGPCTAGSGRALSVGNLASTMMAAFKEPEGLNEREYLAYLGKTSRWDLAKGKLELYSSSSSGGEAVLVFAVK